MRPQHGPWRRVAALPHSGTARPSRLCNLSRPGSVKEFAQCFRAANTVSCKETNHGRRKQVVRCIRNPSAWVRMLDGARALSA